jgi:putative phage-type endonuclease
MRVINLEQGSQEWLQSRLGKPTASNFGKLITPTGKPSTSAEGYINELIAQRITGELPEFYTNEAMARGNELEPAAKAMYEFMHGVEVVEVGLCLHDEFECGASPDGLVGDDGGIEIKCPLPHTHVSYLRAGDVPGKYVPQIQGCLWITGREWWDFMSYHPAMEDLIVRVYRDEAYIKKLADAVTSAVEIIETETLKWSKK